MQGERKVEVQQRPSSEKDTNTEELNYLELLGKVIEHGVERDNRTGIATRSIFGTQQRYDLRKGRIPLLTTRKIFWRGIVEELLWMLRGSTDSKELHAKGVKIWDANGSRSFLDQNGFQDRREGDLGPVYGFQWRHFGAPYHNLPLSNKNDDDGSDATRAANAADSSDLPNTAERKLDNDDDDPVRARSTEVDQIRWLIQRIKTHPTCRRLLLTAWNPSDISKMALPPCHVMAQFWVNTKTQELSCHFYMRSNDLALGLPFNIASYALLTRLMAHLTGLKPGELVHSTGDAHIYVTHIDALREQVTRAPRSFPVLTITGADQVENIEDFCFEHFQLTHYDPHPPIAMHMVA